MKKTLLSLVLLAGFTLVGRSAGLEPAVQAKVDAQIKAIQAWASDPVIVKAVQTHNTGVSAEVAAVTQDKWKTLSILDPMVRGLSKNEAAEFLKTKKGDVISESFISGLDGTKVAFLSKPSNWSHKGKPKHEEPLAGKTWQGAVEVDDSTGLQQVQVAVPVLADGKPIGSLVVGLSLSKLQ